jgi:hypothetical protein
MNNTNATAYKRRAYLDAYLKANRERILKRNRARQAMLSKEKKDNLHQQERNYRANLSPERKEERRQRRLLRYRTECKVGQLLRGRIHSAIRKASTSKAAKTEELLGCTIAEVRIYIESLWLPGMNWSNNTTNGWHIDHIRPCASFNLTDPKQQKECFHYFNLRPMWGIENISKSSLFEGVRHHYKKV